MRAYFYWPACTLDMSSRSGFEWLATPRTVFWVGATPEEVERHILPYLANTDQWTGMSPLEREDSYEYKGRFYFFTPIDLQGVALFIRVYPYSGMWNGDCPWIPIGERRKDGGFHEPEGVEIGTLGQLQSRTLLCP